MAINAGVEGIECHGRKAGAIAGLQASHVAFPTAWGKILNDCTIKHANLPGNPKLTAVPEFP
jgi:hypothetical protein